MELIYIFVVQTQTNMETIHPTTFKRLMKNAVCDYESLMECVGFSAEFGNFYAEFCGYPEDDFKLKVFSFGRLLGKVVTKMEPTQVQKYEMQRMVSLKAESLRNKARTEELEARQAQEDYDRFGHEGAIYGSNY